MYDKLYNLKQYQYPQYPILWVVLNISTKHRAIEEKVGQKCSRNILSSRLDQLHVPKRPLSDVLTIQYKKYQNLAKKILVFTYRNHVAVASRTKTTATT